MTSISLATRQDALGLRLPAGLSPPGWGPSVFGCPCMFMLTWDTEAQVARSSCNGLVTLHSSDVRK